VHIQPTGEPDDGDELKMIDPRCQTPLVGELAPSPRYAFQELPLFSLSLTFAPRLGAAPVLAIKRTLVDCAGA